MITATEIVRNRQGIYSIADAARYAHLPLPTLHHWIRTRSSGASVNQLEGYGDFLTFMDLMQALFVREIRSRYGISMQRIKEAIERSEREHNIKYIFARKSMVYLSGKELFLSPDADSDMVQLTGKAHGQQEWRKLTLLYMRELTYNSDGLADSYTPYRDEKANVSVVLRPDYRFGEPVVAPCGISVEALCDAVDTYGTPELAAQEYEISLSQVMAAMKYRDTILTVPNAA
jgi:uncharacterized protein (DUF433 family)